MFGLSGNKTQKPEMGDGQPDIGRFLDLLLENSPTAITVFDRNGVYTYTKGVALAGVHHKDGESVGKSIFDMYGSFPEIAENARKALLGERRSFIVDVRGAWFSTVFIPVKNASGGVESVVGIATNITAQRETEAKLQSSKQELESIIESLPEPVFVKNRQHVWVLLNQAFCNFIGHTKEELLGKSDYDFFPKAQADIFWSKDEEAFLTEKENENEERFTNAAGEEKTIITKKTVISGAGGEKILVGIISDITESELAAKKIRESELRFKGMFENMNSGVIIYRALDGGNDYEILECNQAAADITKIQRSEILGRPVTEVFPGIKAFGLLDVLKRVWQTGEPQFFPVNRYQDDQLQIWTENRVYKMPTGEVVAIFDDVTEKKKYEQKILDHNRELEELNRIMTGRELKMIELKNEIKQLKKELGEKN